MSHNEDEWQQAKGWAKRYLEANSATKTLEARVSNMFVADSYVSLQKDNVIPEVYGPDIADLWDARSLQTAEYVMDCIEHEGA